MELRKIIRRFIAYPERELFRIIVSTDETVICFESSPDYSDNSWALFKYMIDHGYNRKYQLYWIADRHNEAIEKNENVHVVLRKNYTEAVKLLYKSRYIFYTHGMTGLIRIKENQTIVNLWHGCGYKASRNKDVQDKFSIKKLLNSSKMNFDYILVPGVAFVKTKSVFFNCAEEKVLPIGYPRYDLLHSTTVEWAKIKERWGIGEKKLVMWLPTYRKTGNPSFKENQMSNQYWLPLLRSDDELIGLNQFCIDAGIQLVVKKHRLQSAFFKDNELSNICFIDDNDLDTLCVQLYEILQYTDAIITDYSSIAVDYLLLDKPIAFTLDDYDEYEAKRGFVFENAKEYMPGFHVYKLGDLRLFLQDVKENNDNYSEKRRSLMPQLQNPCECYSKRVLDTFGIVL